MECLQRGAEGAGAGADAESQAQYLQMTTPKACQLVAIDNSEDFSAMRAEKCNVGVFE